MATLGLFGGPLLNLRVEGVPWEELLFSCHDTLWDQKIFFKCRCIPLLDLRTICGTIMGNLDGSG